MAVSPSRIRTAVATEMVTRQGINVDTLATSFMKHKADTCNKYYLVNWLHMESARIAMQCFNTFSMKDETEHIKSQLLKKPQPKACEVINWYSDVCTKLVSMGFKV